MLSIKEKVLIPPQQAMALMDQIVSQVYSEYGYDCVITEIRPTVKHKRSSKHNSDCARDYRTNHVRMSDQRKITAECRKRMGKNYDFVLHHKIPHLHGEFDPK